MRFTQTQEFGIDELLLDEGNYRFRRASDQRQCIEKIYHSSADNFRNIMSSIAEDDLGELLLVYQDPNGDHVVLDGNRRASALKVLANPDFAPTDAVRKRAIHLAEKFEINTSGIQAQVSDDRNLILRTIYERHGSTGGKTRINWPAMAKSRFGYDHDLEMADSEWKVIALLYKLEELNPKLTVLLESNDYKHEVFRRIVPAAIRMKVIPDQIYSERNRSIKKSEKALVNRVAKDCEVILSDIKSGVIGLSRGKDAGIYADVDGVEEYLSKFLSGDENEPEDQGAPEPDNDNSGEAGNNATDDEPNDSSGDQGQDSSDGDQGGSDTPNNGSGSGGNGRTANYGVNESNSVKAAIIQTGSYKFEQLYRSICTVSLNQHPSLVSIGAWSLIEAIGTALDKDRGVSIESFFSKNNLSNWFPGKFNGTYLVDVYRSLKFLSDEANGIKHSATYRSESGLNLRAHYDTLERFLVAVLEKIVADNVQIK